MAADLYVKKSILMKWLASNEYKEPKDSLGRYVA